MYFTTISMNDISMKSRLLLCQMAKFYDIKYHIKLSSTLIEKANGKNPLLLQMQQRNLSTHIFHSNLFIQNGERFILTSHQRMHISFLVQKKTSLILFKISAEINISLLFLLFCWNWCDLLFGCVCVKFSLEVVRCEKWQRRTVFFY